MTTHRICQYDNCGLMAKEITAAGQTIYAYGGNGNLIPKTGADNAVF